MADDLCTSQLKSPPSPLEPTWGFDIDCCQKLSNTPPLGAKFFVKMDQNASNPQDLGTQMKKKWKIAKILAKQIPISKQALLALFILA